MVSETLFTPGSALCSRTLDPPLCSRTLDRPLCSRTLDRPLCSRTLDPPCVPAPWIRASRASLGCATQSDSADGAARNSGRLHSTPPVRGGCVFVPLRQVRRAELRAVVRTRVLFHTESGSRIDVTSGQPFWGQTPRQNTKRTTSDNVARVLAHCFVRSHGDPRPQDPMISA